MNKQARKRERFQVAKQSQHSICNAIVSIRFKPDNVRVIPDAGDIEIVGADTIAKLSAETSEDRSVAAWDQRIVITRYLESIRDKC